MKADAEWWMDEQRVPYVDVILDNHRTPISREAARYLSRSLESCLNGIVLELCTWIVLDGWGKKHHLVQKEVFRSSAPAICGSKPGNEPDATWRTHYPLQHEPSELYGYCARCLAAYNRLEPTA